MTLPTPRKYYPSLIVITLYSSTVTLIWFKVFGTRIAPTSISSGFKSILVDQSWTNQFEYTKIIFQII